MLKCGWLSYFTSYCVVLMLWVLWGSVLVNNWSFCIDAGRVRSGNGWDIRVIASHSAQLQCLPQGYPHSVASLMAQQWGYTFPIRYPGITILLSVLSIESTHQVQDPRPFHHKHANLHGRPIMHSLNNARPTIIQLSLYLHPYQYWDSGCE